MVQWNELVRSAWPVLHGRIDATIADGVERRLSQLISRPVPSADDWSEELDELRLRREPDYDTPGLAVAYATRYMSRRVVSILGVLRTIEGPIPPRMILDFGSGTGATALALDVLPFANKRFVVGIEPSREMRSLAACLSLSPNTILHQREGSLATASLTPNLLSDVQLVVFSACFPYGFNDWSEVAELLGDYRRSSSPTVAVIEPEVKARGVLELAGLLRKRGWPIRTTTSGDFPDFLVSEDLPLNRLTRVWRRAGAPGSHPPTSWWTPPDDCLLIANPTPGWAQVPILTGSESRSRVRL